MLKLTMNNDWQNWLETGSLAVIEFIKAFLLLYIL